jgi:hypothetical protein
VKSQARDDPAAKHGTTSKTRRNRIHVRTSAHTFRSGRSNHAALVDDVGAGLLLPV